jgi:uncharacterized protein (DUF2336 family)
MIRQGFPLRGNLNNKQGVNEMAGIKETKECAVAATTIAMEIVKMSKDGITFGDFLDLANKMMNDPAIKAKLDAALKDVQQVPAELQELNAAEVLELVMAVSSEVIGGLS